MKIQFKDVAAELKSFSMTGTYDGCLEGSRPSCSLRILENERRKAGDGRLMIEPIWKDGRHGKELPSFRCVTFFREFIDEGFCDLEVVYFSEEPLADESLKEYISRFTKNLCYRTNSVMLDLENL